MPPALAPAHVVWSERVLRIVELVSAIALGVMMLVVCASVTLRYVANAPIPDAFDFSRLLLGIAVFWGIVAACGRDDYIRADLFWPALPQRVRWWVDWVGRLVILGFMLALSWKLYDRTIDVQRTNQETAQLGWKIWPFYLAAWIASALAVVAIAAKFAEAIVLGLRNAPDSVSAPKDDKTEQLT